MFRWAPAAALTFATAIACLACGGGAPTQTVNVSDPVAAVHQASGAMANLDSYHVELTLSPEGTDIAIPIDYERGKYNEKITDSATGESTELTTAGGLFTRNCSDSDHCDEWVLHPRNSPSPGTAIEATPNRYWAPTLGGLTTVFPETLGFTAVDLATGWQDKDGSAAVLTAQVDLERAIDENRSRVGIPTDTPGYTNKPSATALPLSAIEIQFDGSGQYYQTIKIYVPGDSNDPYLGRRLFALQRRLG